jgi:hypothetical protein
MKLERLPEGRQEKPKLFGAVDMTTNSVIWMLDSESGYDSPLWSDGTDWYQVWRVGKVIHVEATCWFNSDGEFSVAVTGIDPDTLIRTVNRVADEFCENIG